MTAERCVTHEHLSCFKCLSWSAIIAGALIGIGLSFLLNLFGMVIGLSLVKTAASGTTLAIGGFFGMIIGVIVAMYVAGFASGYLGRTYCPKRNLGTLYGFTTWCLALVLTAVLASSMGSYLSNYSTFVKVPTAVVVQDKALNTTKVDTATVHVDVQGSNTLALASFLLFVLFFVGALSSCFGGHFGMVCGDGCCPTTRSADSCKL